MRNILILIILIILIISFLIFCIHKNKDKFEIDSQSYKHFDNNKPTIIIGTSQYINDHVEELKRLKRTGKYQFIAHQNSFDFFKKKLEFYPDYLSIYDIEVPKKILNYNDIFKKKKLVKLIYYSIWDTDYENICVNSSVLKKGRKYWENYKNTKLKINNRIVIPTELITNNKNRKESQENKKTTQN